VLTAGKRVKEKNRVSLPRVQFTIHLIRDRDAWQSVSAGKNERLADAAVMEKVSASFADTCHILAKERRMQTLSKGDAIRLSVASYPQ